MCNSWLVAIDPGPEHSSFAYLLNGSVEQTKTLDNGRIIELVKSTHSSIVVEMIASYGRPVGESTFETCVFIGEILEASKHTAQRMYRKDVCAHLCGNAKGVNDAVIRQRLIDIYSGGKGKSAAIGTKKNPGPLYGIKKDEWQALALGVAYGEKHLGWKIQ